MKMCRLVSVMLLAASVIAVAVGHFASDSEDTCLSIKTGQICGTKIQTRNERLVYAYKGIPYAKPPVGDRRFKEPEPVEPWECTLDAKENAPVCIQKNYFNKDPIIEGQEDCLYLNVYTPNIPDKHLWARNVIRENNSYPVMVYIHGGGWFYGSGASFWHGPEYILDEDVVLVTFNYRLGIFGFLSTEDDSASGNWALKDMVLVLKWVKENIRNFCGDPDSVTIFGESAGGASVNYLTMSPVAQGLFHRAISQSGTALNIWATPLPSLTIARTQASLVDCTDITNNALVDCLRKVDAKTLLTTQDKFKFWSIEPLIIFLPTVEKKTALNPNPIITDTPQNLIKEGKFTPVPYMFGTVANEGLIRASAIIAQSKLRDELNEQWNTLGPMIYGASLSVVESEIPNLWQNITNFYMKGQRINHSDPINIQNYINMYGDRSFIYGIYKTAIEYAKKQEAHVYFYNFNYAGENTWADLFAATGQPNNYSFSICHCDDLLYLFKIPALFPDLKPNSNDEQMSKKLVKLWTQFAINGTPSRFWNRVTGNGSVPYLEISGPKNLKMKPNFLQSRMEFWKNLDIAENK